MTEIFENIRKIYNFAAPSGELAEHIEFFSESSVEATKRHIAGEYFSVKMFPSYTPTLYINLGAPYQISVSGKRHFIGADADILILRNSIVERFNTAADNIFTVKFYPGSLEAILDIKQSLLADKVISLKQILPAKLLNQIKRPVTFNERIGLIQDFFVANLRKPNDYYLKFVNVAIDNFSETGFQASNADLAERMFSTSKTINRYFNQVIGTAPKNYFSIMRTRNALTGYVNNKPDFIPYNYGYYDMSHFYKDVVKFTGQKLAAHTN